MCLYATKFPTRRGGIDKHRQRAHIGLIRLGKEYILFIYVVRSKTMWLVGAKPSEERKVTIC